jgi:putative membrane protein
MKPKIFIFLAGLAHLIWAGEALAQQVGYGGRCWQFPGMWGGGWFGGPMMLLFWGLIAVLLFIGVRWAVKGRSNGSSDYSRRDSAMDLLRRRYAAGEIDQETFQDMKRELEAS